MSNYPDDIGNYTCPRCKEITPSCVCQENYEEALHEKRIAFIESDEYIEMFNSADSEEVVYLLQNLHADPSEENLNTLLKQLNVMVDNLTD